MTESIKINRIEVSIQDLAKVDRLLSDIENNRGILHDNLRDIRIMGHTYTVILNREFDEVFDNVEKFEMDYKVEVNKIPKTTQSYFKDVEIARLRLIDNTIKKCFHNNNTYFREFPQYVGMCSYLEFLENYKLNPNYRNENIVQNNDKLSIKTDYSQIARRLIANKYPIDVQGLPCESFEDYIEEERKHCNAPNFYKTLLRVMGEVCSKKKQGNYDTGLDTFISARFKEVLSYCKSKMYPIHQQPDFDTSNKTNPYIFNDDILTSFTKFNGLLWDKLDRNWFRQNPTKIILKKDCTQRVFIYFFDKFKDRRNCELCPSPTDWLPLIFTKAFNYTNQRNEIKLLTNTINQHDRKSKSFNIFKEKIDSLISEIDKTV